MNDFEIMNQARIVQEVLREDYDCPVESALMVEHLLAGAAKELQAHGYEVVAMYIQEGGKNVFILVLHKGEFTISVPA